MKKRLKRSGIAYVIFTIVNPVIVAIIFFGSAGRVNMPRAWLFFSATFIYYLLGIALLYKHSPELLNHRGDWRKKKDAKTWDRILVTVYGIIAFYVQIIVAGLDVGRFGWSDLGIRVWAVAFALYTLGIVFMHWAMLVNPHFETTVRIQKDRGHRVIKDGPYGFVRHPGYTAIILWTVTPPLVLGSLYAIIPAGVAVLIIVVRTSLEDKTLHNELAGYAEYAKEVKYKLIPGIW